MLIKYNRIISKNYIHHNKTPSISNLEKIDNLFTYKIPPIIIDVILHLK